MKFTYASPRLASLWSLRMASRLVWCGAKDGGLFVMSFPTGVPFFVFVKLNSDVFCIFSF